ncbi:hypothetical protein [Rubrivivax albus]|uniref:Uncharacterized protein n=1 Tax=Rubrivivax albus TaxID=2499835 RepID=A0A437JT62_9BURK|nr:hypothetical protein [Rubrivivax albus]RVT50350.1 hypothetical protein ENE75_15130 [Rubrivivax albus]
MSHQYTNEMEDTNDIASELAAVAAAMLRYTDGGHPYRVAQTLTGSPRRFERRETVAAYATLIHQASEAWAGLRSLRDALPDPDLAAWISERHARLQPADAFEQRGELLADAGDAFAALVHAVVTARDDLECPRRDTGSRARRVRALASLRSAPATLAALMVEQLVPAAQQVGHALTFMEVPGYEHKHRAVEHLQRHLNSTLDLLVRASTTVRQMDRAALQAELRKFGRFWAPFFMVASVVELLALLIHENADELILRLPARGWAADFPEAASHANGAVRNGLQLALANGGGGAHLLSFMEGRYRTRGDALDLAARAGLVPMRVASWFMPKRW